MFNEAVHVPVDDWLASNDCFNFIKSLRCKLLLILRLTHLVFNGSSDMMTWHIQHERHERRNVPYIFYMAEVIG